MATVFMKWLETSPKDYDRGINMLTLGRLQRLKELIAHQYIRPGNRVLEIGCGTGSLMVMMAERGAQVIAIDASSAMLAEAEAKVASTDSARSDIVVNSIADLIDLHHIDASQIADKFPPRSFDLIVSTLVFSEMPPNQGRFVLESCRGLLVPGGQILLADEVIPQGILARTLFYLVRLPLAALTWLLTRTTTKALRDPEAMFSAAGFHARPMQTYLGGSLVLYAAEPVEQTAPAGELPKHVAGRLKHQPSLRTRLRDLWALFFRIIPPYPKVSPGLYAVGDPNRSSPVLVTGNYDLTVRRLLRAIDGRLDAWVLVADSSGINVWCAAGGGFFTAEKIIAALKACHLEEVVDHHALILPQLCANGVDGWRIRELTAWGVHWGPPRAEDIPAYLKAGRKKSDEMRWVDFPLKDRLEMTTVTLGFYGLLILLPVLIFWRFLFLPVTVSMLGISYSYAIVLPWLPGRDGLAKSIPLTVIVLLGLFICNALWGSLSTQSLFNWTLGLTGMAVFSAGELQGMSPRMRGEQANWIPEGVIFVALLSAWWLLPLALGWR